MATAGAYELKPDPRRWFERVHVDSPVTLRSGGRTWSCVLGDVSSSGCRLERPEGCDLKIDDFVTIDFVGDPPALDALHGRVARISERNIGVHFQDESDPHRFAR